MITLFQTSCNIAALKHARLCGGREPEQRTGTKNDGVGAGPGWPPPLLTAPARGRRAPACCRGRGYSHCSPSHSRHGPLLRPAAGIGARPSACRCLVRRHLPPPSWPAASAHGRPAAATAAAVAGAAVVVPDQHHEQITQYTIAHPTRALLRRGLAHAEQTQKLALRGAVVKRACTPVIPLL